MCPGVRPEGWLSGLPTPLVVLSAGGMRSTLLLLLTPYFCSWLFRSGSWGFFFWSFCVLSIICPICTCRQLFLVPYSFFVFCCWRRHLPRFRHCSKGSRVPACLKLRLGQLGSQYSWLLTPSLGKPLSYDILHGAGWRKEGWVEEGGPQPFSHTHLEFSFCNTELWGREDEKCGMPALFLTLN